MVRVAGIGLVLLVTSLGGCSSILDGFNQEVVVNTVPSGASCVLSRQGVTLGHMDKTPGALTVRKSKHDITIVCDKDGYQQASVINKSGVAGATFGNIILGGAVGWVVDSSTGADNKYDSPVTVTMTPEAPPPVAATGATVTPVIESKPAPLTN